MTFIASDNIKYFMFWYEKLYNTPRGYEKILCFVYKYFTWLL